MSHKNTISHVRRLLLVDRRHRCIVVVHVHRADQIVVIVDGQAVFVRSELLYVHHGRLSVVAFDLLPDPFEEQGDACKRASEREQFG